MKDSERFFYMRDPFLFFIFVKLYTEEKLHILRMTKIFKRR